jgi:hypothetical protein
MAPRTSSPMRGPSGLWSSITSPTGKDNDDADDLVPNFNDPRSTSQDSATPNVSVSVPVPVAASVAVPAERPGWSKQLPKRTSSQRGLWGSAASLEDREASARRRWTVAEQKL